MRSCLTSAEDSRFDGGEQQVDRFLLRTITPFVAALAGQLGAVALLPRTQGFTAPVPTMACISIFVFSIWMIARISHSGASLSILVPLLNAIVPLGAVSIGMVVYGETASFLKIGVLVIACTLIGVASRLH
jgi:quaternary ammonium compound-resistance protein SugE